MKIKDFLSATNRLEKIEHNIIIKDNTLTIRYSLIFNKINIRITYLDQEYFFELKLNDQGELCLDLTEDRELIKQIDNKDYFKIINKIFGEDI